MDAKAIMAGIKYSENVQTFYFNENTERNNIHWTKANQLSHFHR